MNAPIRHHPQKVRSISRTLKGRLIGESIQLLFILEDQEEVPFENHCVPELDEFLGDMVSRMLGLIDAELHVHGRRVPVLELISHSLDEGEHPCQITRLELTVLARGVSLDLLSDAARNAQRKCRHLLELVCPITVACRV